MSRFHGFRFAFALTVFCGMTACIVEEHPAPPPDTEIGFDPVTNLGQGCSGRLTSWQVTNRSDATNPQTGLCGDTIIFGGLVPNERYTFDILGYSGAQLCWQGACEVPTEYGILTWGDCHQSIQYLCSP
jgi:hypothetical protein